MGGTRDTTATFGEGDEPARRVQRPRLLQPKLTRILDVKEPWRVGESCLIPPLALLYLGRDRHELDAALTQQLSPSGDGREGRALIGEAISRRQCELANDDELTVTNVGRAPLLLNGTGVEKKVRTVLHIGDVLVIPRHYAFLIGEGPDRFTLNAHYPTNYKFGEADPFGIVGESYAIWKARERIAQAALDAMHVMLLGETGVGKELAARALHGLSDRATKPYILRNAMTLGLGVADAELFGHPANFPNAGMQERIGLIGEARDGHLVLDEVGGLPRDIQRKLLTFMDAGIYTRVGESRERVSNAIIIAAMNAAIETLENDFGRRFKVKIHLPSLAERREDIPLLARHIVLSIASKGRGGAKRFVYEMNGRLEVRMSCDFITWLVRREYTGNIRELEEILREAMYASAGDTIELEAEVAGIEPAAEEVQTTVRDDDPTPDELRNALAQTKSQEQAAVLLAISRDRVKRLKKKYGL